MEARPVHEGKKKELNQNFDSAPFVLCRLSGIRADCLSLPQGLIWIVNLPDGQPAFRL